MKYSKQAIERTREIERKLLKRKNEEEVDVFGRPLSAPVSPRVQRIRDLQAGRRTAPAQPKRDPWGDMYKRANTAPPVRRSVEQAEPQGAGKAQTYEEMIEEMRTAMDRAADHMEKVK